MTNKEEEEIRTWDLCASYKAGIEKLKHYQVLKVIWGGYIRIKGKEGRVRKRKWGRFLLVSWFTAALFLLLTFYTGQAPHTPTRVDAGKRNYIVSPYSYQNYWFYVSNQKLSVRVRCESNFLSPTENFPLPFHQIINHVHERGITNLIYFSTDRLNNAL